MTDQNKLKTELGKVVSNKMDKTVTVLVERAK
jgi:ribosomal protein S17